MCRNRPKIAGTLQPPCPAWQLALFSSRNTSSGRKPLRHHTSEGPSSPLQHFLGTPCAAGNSSNSFPTYFYKSSNVGMDHKINHGTVPLNITLKMFSISYTIQFLCLWKSSHLPTNRPACFECASKNSADSLASAAARVLMGWLTAANQLPSKKKRSCLRARRLVHT